MELKDMTVPQRNNRIIALGDLIRTHETHLRKLNKEIERSKLGFDALVFVKRGRIDRLNELRAEKLLLEEEAAR